MPEDLAVNSVIVDSTTRLTPRGDIEPIMRVRFRIGDHGPFSLEFKKADFTPENVKREQDAIAATIRSLPR
jgi:hypothetical protein